MPHIVYLRSALYIHLNYSSVGLKPYLMWCSSVDLTRYTSVCNSGSDLELIKTQTITFQHFITLSLSPTRKVFSNIRFKLVRRCAVVMAVVGLSRCGGDGLDMGNCSICWMTGGVSPLLSSGGCSLFRTLNTACPATYPARHCSAQYTPVKSGLGFNIE